MMAVNFDSFLKICSYAHGLQDKIVKIRDKLRRSLEFLDMDRSKAAVYVAGNYWSDEVAVQLAHEFGFGTMGGNGHDLEVQEPCQKSQ